MRCLELRNFQGQRAIVGLDPSAPGCGPEGLEGRASTRWYAIQTKPKRESSVQAALDRTGIEVYCPRVRRAHGRADRKSWHETPLFPGYLFARFDFGRDYPRVRWTSGLVRVVMGGGTPLELSEATLSSVRQMEREGFDVRHRPVQWKPGVRARVVRGPFAGFEGRVAVTLKGGLRVRVLLELFRRQAAVECDPDLLQALAAAGGR